MPLSFRRWTSGRKRGNEPITGRSWQGITRCAACKGGATPGLNVFTPVVPWVGIKWPPGKPKSCQTALVYTTRLHPRDARDDDSHRNYSLV